MRALVTGATGFLGGVLTARLLDDGDTEVRALVRPGSRTQGLEVARARPGSKHLRNVTGTLASVESARRVLDEAAADVVFHLAAGMKGAAADIFAATVVASRNLLEAATKTERPPKVVLVSSFGVYGVAGIPAGALVNEETPLEQRPERRDPYSHAKLRQETLFREYAERNRLELVVVRPGVLYGPGGSALSARVGLLFPGIFLHLGRGNPLPLSYAENCADALALLSRSPAAVGQAYNVHDDELPSCRRFLRLYRQQVDALRFVTLPYAALVLLARLIEGYHRRSRGQLPAILTPYKVASLWKGQRFENRKLKALGWTPRVPIEEGLARHFAHLSAMRRPV
jgi:nucleoside-diphosphate-sugar epimerase